MYKTLGLLLVLVSLSTAACASKARPNLAPTAPATTQVVYPDCFGDFDPLPNRVSYRSNTLGITGAFIGTKGRDANGAVTPAPLCQFLLKPGQDMKGPDLRLHESPNGASSWYIFGKCIKTVRSRDAMIGGAEYEPMYLEWRDNDGWTFTCESDPYHPGKTGKRGDR